MAGLPRSGVQGAAAAARQRRLVQVYLFDDRERTSVHAGPPPRTADAPRLLHAEQAAALGRADDLLVYTFWGEPHSARPAPRIDPRLLHSVLKFVPLWLDEGLAEYFECRRMEGPQPQARPEGCDAREAAVQPDLARLETLRAKSSEMNRADYQESWAWVYLDAARQAGGEEGAARLPAPAARTPNPPQLGPGLAKGHLPGSGVGPPPRRIDLDSAAEAARPKPARTMRAETTPFARQPRCPMNVLVTAGNTHAHRPRALPHQHLHRPHRRRHRPARPRARPHRHPAHLAPRGRRRTARRPVPAERWTVLAYRTFDELQRPDASCVRTGGLDAVIHSAAVSDYLPAGVYAPAAGTRFDPDDGRWAGGRRRAGAARPRRRQGQERRAGAVAAPGRAPKLIDLRALRLGLPRRAGQVQAGGRRQRRGLLEIAERCAAAFGGRPDGRQHAGRAAAYAFLGPLRRRLRARRAARTGRRGCSTPSRRCSGSDVMANVLLGVTGSVAAHQDAGAVRRTAAAGHAVKVVATRAAPLLLRPGALAGRTERDPASSSSTRTSGPAAARAAAAARRPGAAHRAAPLGRPAADRPAGREHAGQAGHRPVRQLPDLRLARLGRARPVVLAPAMNTLMWQHPVTVRHLRQLAADAGADAAGAA